MVRLLLINTCGFEGIVAVAEEDRVLASEVLPGRSASEELLPAIRRMMDGLGWSVGELNAVAVVEGPGSFTGVRVGLSTAKGLCEGSGAGLIAMSRLALLAPVVEGDAVALLDAGRGEYYCGIYREGRRVAEELLGLEEVRARLEGVIAVTCEARVAEGLGEGVQWIAEPGAEAMLAMALGRIAAAEWSDVAAADANYLRRTDAELLAKGRAKQ